MPDAAALSSEPFGCQMFGLPSPEAAPQPPTPPAAPPAADASLGADPPEPQRPSHGWYESGLAL